MATESIPAFPKPGVRTPLRQANIWLLVTLGCTVAALVAAGLLAPTDSASPAYGLGWLLFVGSSVHVAATGWLYTVPEVRGFMMSRPTRYVWTPVALIAASAALAAILPPSTFIWALLPYVGWQLFHFQKQNIGMASLAATSHGGRGLAAVDRRMIVTAGWFGALGIVAKPALVSRDLTPALSVLFWPALLGFAITVAAGVAVMVRAGVRSRSVARTSMYLVALLFPLPVFLFSSPYAGLGGLAIAHGFQYLILVGLLAASQGSGIRRATGLLVLTAVGLAGGLALAFASHLHSGDPLVRLMYGAYLGVGMSHFVVDAGIWRLRDSFPRHFVATRLPYLLPAVST